MAFCRYPLRQVLLPLALLLVGHMTLRAQEGFDVTAAVADPFTLQFNDGKNTVKGFIYYMLETQTRCCGTDNLYLEVRIGKGGKTQGVRVLTGRLNCIKQSVADILMLLQWDSTFVKGNERVIFFDIKPAIGCKGLADDNTYYPVGLPGTNTYLAQAKPPATTPSTTSPQPTTPALASGERPTLPNPSGDPPAATPQPSATQPPATPSQPSGTAQQPSATTPTSPQPRPTTPPATTPAAPTETPTTRTNPNPATPTPRTNPTPAAPTPQPRPQPQPQARPTVEPPKPTAPAIDTRNTPPARENPGYAPPPVPKPVYASQGDLRPDSAHAGSHTNRGVPLEVAPVYIDGDAAQAVFLRRELRNAQICGLIHTVVELTLVRTDSVGVVAEVRILRANRPEVAEVMPFILQKLTYKSETVGLRQRIYYEFKTDIPCEDGTPKTDLDAVEPYLNLPRGGAGSASDR